MCPVCDKKVNKKDGVAYRHRASGRAIIVHEGCEWAALEDTRVMKEGAN